MARPAGPKTKNNGQWTEARFKGFIMSGLRRLSMRSWAPISQALKNARVDRGEYVCASCKQVVPASIRNEDGKRVKNVHVDHILPVIDVDKGFESWDKVIERLFSEADNLQVLCGDCHTKKSRSEIDQRVEARKIVEVS